MCIFFPRTKSNRFTSLDSSVSAVISDRLEPNDLNREQRTGQSSCTSRLTIPNTRIRVIFVGSELSLDLIVATCIEGKKIQQQTSSASVRFVLQPPVLS